MIEVPDFLQSSFAQACKCFGIDTVNWHISVRMTDRPGGEFDNDGSAYIDYKYLNATIEFGNKLANDIGAVEIVLHEVGHIALAEVDSVVQSIADQLDEDRRAVFLPLYMSAVERYLQRTSRSLAANAICCKNNVADS